MTYPLLSELENDFIKGLVDKKSIIEELVRSQLRAQSCRLADEDVWEQGGSHVAIPCYLDPERTVWFRSPLPHAVREHGDCGHGNECLSTEVASYLCIEENCPDVPIPTLHSFGFADGSTFSHPSLSPLWPRVRWLWRSFLRGLRAASKPVGHVLQARHHQLGLNFMIISDAQGKSVESSWDENRATAAYRHNLFRDLARVQLSLGAIHFPAIGSPSLQPDASVALTNRPLNPYILEAEREGVFSGIPRNRTYTTTESYVADLLSFHDKWLAHKDNFIASLEYGRRQLAALVILRSTAHLFTNQEFRNGPFQLTLTELHMPNIFTDDTGRITTIIDIGAAALPREMVPAPRWTILDVDEFCCDSGQTMNDEQLLNEYLAIYAEEAAKRAVGESAKRQSTPPLTSKQVWFFSAVTMPGAMLHFFNNYIQPLFNEKHPDMRVFGDVVYSYWSPVAESFIKRKLQERPRDES